MYKQKEKGGGKSAFTLEISLTKKSTEWHIFILKEFFLMFEIWTISAIFNFAFEHL